MQPVSHYPHPFPAACITGFYESDQSDDEETVSDTDVPEPLPMKKKVKRRRSGSTLAAPSTSKFTNYKLTDTKKLATETKKLSKQVQCLEKRLTAQSKAFEKQLQKLQLAVKSSQSGMSVKMKEEVLALAQSLRAPVPPAPAPPPLDVVGLVTNIAQAMKPPAAPMSNMPAGVSLEDLERIVRMLKH